MNSKTLLSPHTITQAASVISGTPINVIRGRSRAASVVAVRDLCIKICKDHVFSADREIAVAFGKERSTVCVVLKRVKKNLLLRNQYRLMLELVEEELGL